MPGLLDIIGKVSPQQYFQFGAGVLSQPSNVGLGIQQGLLGASQAKEKLEERKRKEQLQAAIGDVSLPLELRNLLSSLPPDQAGGVLAQYMMQGQEEPELNSVRAQAILMPDKSIRAARPNDPLYDQLIAQGGIPLSGYSVQASTTGDLTPFSAKQRGEGLDAANAHYANVAEIDVALKMLSGRGVAHGAINTARRGAASVGGLVDDILGFANIESDIEGWADPGGKATEFQVQGGALIGRMISTITGDTSGRYTDIEREITERYSKMDTSKASEPQMREALTTLRDIEDRAGKREELKAAGIPDITTKAGSLAYTRRLQREKGITEDEALAVVLELKRRFGIEEDFE